MNSLRYLARGCIRRPPLFTISQRAGFKSKLSLDKLYPNSTLDMAANPTLPKNDEEVFSGVIPIDKVTLTYCASSGPGGQNVNSVNTKVDMRFHVMSAEWIPEKTRENFVRKFTPYINKDGFCVLKSDKTRLQALNVADCLDKLRFMVRDAEKAPVEPSPEDLVTQLYRHEKAVRERVREKRIRSEIKRSRRDLED